MNNKPPKPDNNKPVNVGKKLPKGLGKMIAPAPKQRPDGTIK